MKCMNVVNEKNAIIYCNVFVTITQLVITKHIKP